MAVKKTTQKEGSSWVGKVEEYSRKIWLAGLGVYSKIDSDGKKSMRPRPAPVPPSRAFPRLGTSWKKLSTSALTVRFRDWVYPAVLK